VRGGGRSYFLRPRKQRENANPTVGGAIASTLGRLTVACTGTTAASSTVDMVVQRFDGGTGSVLVSSGVPLQPGAMFPADVSANKGAVLVNGVEQTRHISALKGKFPDGSLRAVLVQFTYSIPDASAITASFLPGVAATNSNATGTTVTYTNVLQHGRFLPSSATYLCETEVTLQPLLAYTAMDAAGQAWADAAYTGFGVFSASQLDTALAPGPAQYEQQRGFFAFWCMTGNTAYWQQAVRRMRAHMEYLTPATTYTIGGAPVGAQVNTDGMPGSGGISEPYSLWPISLLNTYWLTGWEQCWRTLTWHVQNRVAIKSTYAIAAGTTYGYVGPQYGARFNTGLRGIAWMVVGYLGECTAYWAYSSDGSPGRLIDYPTELPWVIDALEARAWNDGSYCDGIVGLASTNTDATGSTSSPAHATNAPTNFQLPIPAEYLTLYYRYIYPDSRIPGMLAAQGTFCAAQVRAYVPSYDLDYGTRNWVWPYAAFAPADIAARPIRVDTPVGDYIAGGGALIPMAHGMWGWLYANTGSATWLTWATRAEDSLFPNGVTISGKQWAELWGWSPAGQAYRAGATDRPTWAPSTITQPPSH
jgi:hypothetical protein